VFAATSVLTLGLAIGANTAIFGVIESILWKPLPFPEQDRTVAVLQRAQGVGIKLAQLRLPGDDSNQL
jgi:hypothetical protein